MITLSFIAAAVFLYWLGGQRWAHTLFRDLGCSLCIFGLAWFIFGFSWSLVLIIPIAWTGMTIGDHDWMYWGIHGFVISLCMLPYAIDTHDSLSLCLMSVVVSFGTYIVSRFANKWGIDVIGRGLLYATIPLWFLIRA